jgi:hypothetical protein
MDPTPIPPQPAQPQSETPTTPPKKKSHILIDILILLFGVSIGLMVNKTTLFSALRIPFRTVAPTPLVSPASPSLGGPKPTAKAGSPDPTVNWKTYTSQKNTYSFKYPDGLTSDAGAAGTGYESIRFILIGPTQIASGRTQTELFDGYSFSITKLGPVSQIDPKTEIEKQEQNSKNVCTKVSAVSNIVVSRLNAFQYSSDCMGSNTITVVTDGVDTYSITQMYTNNSYKTITDQILSTFKFANEAKITIEKKFGYIKTITPSHDIYQLSVDLAQFINDDSKPNGFRIDNPSNELTSFPLEQNPSVIMQTFSHVSDGNFHFNQTVSFSDFLSKFQSDSTLKTIPYWFDLENGTITKITEQYIP